MRIEDEYRNTCENIRYLRMLQGAGRKLAPY